MVEEQAAVVQLEYITDMPQHRLAVFQRLASYKRNKTQVVVLRHWFILQAQSVTIWTVLPHGPASRIQLRHFDGISLLLERTWIVHDFFQELL